MASGIQLAPLLTEIKLNLDSFKKNTKSVEEETKSLGKKIADNLNGEKIGANLTKLGGTLTKNLTLPIVGVSTVCGKLAMDFESSMAKVSTIADTTQVPMKDMEKSILGLSKQTGISASEIANNVYDAISAGQKTGDAVNFVSNATKLAKAGFAESGQTLDVLTTIMNSYGLEAKEVTNVSDILINTQNVGKTTVAELSASMGKVIPTAKSVNVNLQQLASGYALMTSKGIATAESTTYMNSMFNEMGKSGTKASDTIKKLTGKSFQDLMKDGKSVGDVLALMDQHAKKNNMSLADMFGSAEAGKAALVLSENAGKDFNSTLKQMGNVTGATEEAFNKMNNTTENKLKVALNNLKIAGIQLGTTLLPVVTKLAEGFTKVISVFNNLSPKTQGLIVKLALLTATVGPVMAIVGKCITIFTKLKAAFVAVKTVCTLLGVTFTGTIAPILAIGAAVTGLVILVVKNWDEIKATTIVVWNAIKAYFTVVWDNIKGIFLVAWNGIKQVCTDTLNNIKEFITTIWNNIKMLWEHDLFGIRSITEGIFNAIKIVIDTVLKVIVDIFNIFKNLFSGNWKECWNSVKKLFEDIWNGIKDFLGNMLNKIVDAIISFGIDAYNTIKTVWNKFWDGCKEIWNLIIQWIKDTFNSIVEWIKNLWTTFKETAKLLWNKFLDGCKELWNLIIKWIKDAFNNMVETIKNVADLLLEAGKHIFNFLWNGCKEIWNALINWLKQVVNDPVGTIKNIGSAMFNAGKNIITSLWDGCKNIWNSVCDWFSDKVNWIKEKVSFWNNSKTEMSDKTNGSHFNGLSYVPYDGYNARLHKGEMVLTEDEARNYRNGGMNGKGGITQNITINSPKQLSPSEIARQNKYALQQLALQM